MKTKTNDDVGRNGPGKRKRKDEWTTTTLISAKTKKVLKTPKFFDNANIFLTQNCVNGPPGTEWPPG
jgi:hypothetical protein